MALASDDDEAKIDAALREWRQGDCVLGEQWLLYRFDPARPLTPEAAAAAAEGDVDAAEANVRGLVLVTQTCDIVRTCAERRFIQVCPLVEVDAEQTRQIKRAQRPRYAFLANLESQRLVADLDRIMTVEKAVVAGWVRTPGWSDDAEARSIAAALTRSRARVAFPDDFVKLVRGLADRLSGKHGKTTDEGRALRALQEIRVLATPSWQAEKVDLFFWFLRATEAPVLSPGTSVAWDEHLATWLARVPPKGRFRSVGGVVQTLDNLTAQDYLDSDRLDLDHLSMRP